MNRNEPSVVVEHSLLVEDEALGVAVDDDHRGRVLADRHLRETWTLHSELHIEYT